MDDRIEQLKALVAQFHAVGVQSLVRLASDFDNGMKALAMELEEIQPTPNAKAPVRNPRGQARG